MPFVCRSKKLHDSDRGLMYNADKTAGLDCQVSTQWVYNLQLMGLRATQVVRREISSGASAMASVFDTVPEERDLLAQDLHFRV